MLRSGFVHSRGAVSSLTQGWMRFGASYSTSYRDLMANVVNSGRVEGAKVAAKPASEIQRLSSAFTLKAKPSVNAAGDVDASNLEKDMEKLNKRVMKTWHTASKRHEHIFTDPSVPYMPKEFRVRKDTQLLEKFDSKGRPVTSNFSKRLPNPTTDARNAPVSAESDQEVARLLGSSRPQSELLPSDFDNVELEKELQATLNILKKAEKEALINHYEEKVWTKRTELRNPDMEREAKALGIRDLYRSSHLDSSEKKDLVNLLESEPDSVTYEPLATFNLKHTPDMKRELHRRNNLFGVKDSAKRRVIETTDPKVWRKALYAAGETAPSVKYSELFADEQAAVSEEEFISLLSRVFPQYSHQMLQSIIQRMYTEVGSDGEENLNHFKSKVRALTDRLLGNRKHAQESLYHNNMEYIRDFPDMDNLEEQPIVYTLHEYLKKPREVKMVKIIRAFKKLYKGSVSREEMLAMESLSQKYEPVIEDIKETGDYNFQEHCNILYSIMEPIIEQDFVTHEPEIKLKKKRTKVITLRATGKGSRKASHARCIITPGTGILTINGKCYTEYFKNRRERILLMHVYKYANCWTRFNVDVRVKGGGITGQGAAAQLAMVNALIAFNPKNKYAFRLQGMLTKDKRQVERKKAGQKKARKKFAWVKR